MRVIVPPIKSQGIKTKLVPWIKSLAPAVSGRWIEPFLGTGVVAFNSGCPKALLGEINPHIIRFYEAVKQRDGLEEMPPLHGVVAAGTLALDTQLASHAVELLEIQLEHHTAQ